MLRSKYDRDSTISPVLLEQITSTGVKRSKGDLPSEMEMQNSKKVYSKTPFLLQYDLKEVFQNIPRKHMSKTHLLYLNSDI